MKKYKLNCHAHSRYSDGHGTIKEMALAYKAKGFSCAVITDHWYCRNDLSIYSMTKDKFLKAIKDAEEVEKELNFPIIIGMEYSFFRCEEVACFGRNFLIALYDEVKTVEDFKEAKAKYNGAAIVVHPSARKNDNGFLGPLIKGHEVVDGYERYNHRQDMFKADWREVPKEFENLRAYANSDAHSITGLDFCWNLVDEEIKSEEQLVDYIRDKKPVELVVNDKGWDQLEEENKKLEKLIKESGGKGLF